MLRWLVAIALRYLAKTARSIEAGVVECGLCARTTISPLAQYAPAMGMVICGECEDDLDVCELCGNVAPYLLEGYWATLICPICNLETKIRERKMIERALREPESV